MFPTAARLSRTTYRGARGSGPGASGKTSARSSPKSRNTLGAAIASGQAFKRSQRGLYHGVQLQSGHNVPKSRQKTARVWKPNVQTRRLESQILGQLVEARLTTKALRCIKKAGSLDEYIRTAKDDVLGEFGRRLRSEMAAMASLRLKMEGLGLATSIKAQREKRERSQAGRIAAGTPRSAAAAAPSSRSA